MSLQQYSMVRIVKLSNEANSYDGWKVNVRSPAIGDVGTLLDILTAPNLPNRYVVECVADDGMTIWLGDFREDELEDV